MKPIELLSGRKISSTDQVHCSGTVCSVPSSQHEPDLAYFSAKPKYLVPFDSC